MDRLIWDSEGKVLVILSIPGGEWEDILEKNFTEDQLKCLMNTDEVEPSLEMVGRGVRTGATRKSFEQWVEDEKSRIGL